MTQPAHPRYLIINADDFGIGPGTSEGILQLATQKLITSSVMLANSPHAAAAADRWHALHRPLELGWHPTLTLDAPLLPPDRVPSLVDTEGRFFPLGAFLKRVMLRRVNPDHVHAELQAQFDHCRALLDATPTIVNAHHHIHALPGVGAALRGILSHVTPRPYIRLVREPWPMLWKITDALPKRLFLNCLGRAAARRQRRAGFLGNDWLAGVIDTGDERHGNIQARWIARIPGNVVELACHPGHLDPTLIGRDCTADDGMLERRQQEMRMLADPAFTAAWQSAGFTLITPGELGALYRARSARAA